MGLNMMTQGLLFFTVPAVFIPLVMFQAPHVQLQTIESFPFTLGAIFLMLLYYFVWKWYDENEKFNFDNLKDLMKGCIETEIVELQDAYRHFKNTPEIEITRIKEELRDFQKVTVNYIYDERFEGEMEFRCRPFSPNYYAIEFLSQIEEARATIEVIQVLNHLEYFMSMNDYF